MNFESLLVIVIIYLYLAVHIDHFKNNFIDILYDNLLLDILGINHLYKNFLDDIKS